MADPRLTVDPSRGQSIYSAFEGAWTNIYVIGPLGGPYKVGIAATVERRLKGLQTGNPNKLFVEDSWPVPEPDAFSVEHYAHTLLAGSALTGEWFGATLPAVKAAARRALSDMEAGTIPTALTPSSKRRRSDDGLAKLFALGALSASQLMAGRQYRYLYETRARAEAGSILPTGVWGSARANPMAILHDLTAMERAAASVGATTGVLLLRRVAGDGHMLRDMLGNARCIQQARLRRLLSDVLDRVAGAAVTARA